MVELRPYTPLRMTLDESRPDGNWPEMGDILPEDNIGDDQVTFPSIGFAAPLAAFYRTTTLAR
jgi:hypothetical protein